MFLKEEWGGQRRKQATKGRRRGPTGINLCLLQGGGPLEKGVPKIKKKKKRQSRID